MSLKDFIKCFNEKWIYPFVYQIWFLRSFNQDVLFKIGILGSNQEYGKY